MELKINLATASLKDAEHAIFLIGAYFGLTQSTVAGVGVTVPSTPPAALSPIAAAAIVAAAHTPPTSTPPAGNDQPSDPAAVFGTTPAALPPGAGEAPMTADPAAVFAGNATSPSGPANAATAPVGTPGIPGAAPSAAPVAGPAVGDAGNAAAGAAGSATSSSAGTTAPVAGGSPVTPAGVELDADGLPWDQRINAAGEGGAKPKNADGRWRKKRGLNDAAYVATVQAELRQTLAAGTPAAAVAPVAPPPPVMQPQAQVPTPPAVAPVAPPPPPVAQAPAQPQADPVTFEQLMPRITSAVMAGTLPQTALLQAVTAYQLPNIPALATRPDLVPTVWAYLRSMYPALV